MYPRLSMFTQLNYSVADATITVPILCQWYQQDLVSKNGNYVTNLEDIQ